MFAAGDLVIYGGEGVCRVESVGMPETEGIDKTKAYYTLSPLYRTGQVMTPVDTGVLMRPVMTPAEEPEGASQRAIKDHYHAVVTSYDCGRMAAMIKYTCQRRRAAQQRGRKVSQLDERYLRRAEDQLYGELAVALGIDRQEVCQYIQKDYPAWPEE